MSRLLKAALKYRQMGFSVIPCRDKGKHLIAWKKYQKRLPTNEEIESWWSQWPDAMVAIVCGKISGVTVVDTDTSQVYQELQQILPDNLLIPTVKTPRGYHLYFKHCPGIKNEAGRSIKKGIDVRNDGGIIIAPPSRNHRGLYQWMDSLRITDLTLPDLPTVLSKKFIANNNGNRPGTYGQTALSNELAKLGQASVGQRNDILNQASYSLGQLVAGGELDYGTVFASLLGVALSVGLKEYETRKTIESGMKAGALEPRSINHNNDFGRLTEQDIDDVITCKQVKTNESKSIHFENNLKTFENNGENTSLAERIYDWITNSPGSFTNQDIDREFCLTTRQEKINRSVILNRLYGKIYIKKDKRKKGLWHVVDQNIDFVDLDADEPTSFPIELPFKIHEYVKIPPKAIILLAGSSNAGKTAFILNTLRMNLKQDYNRLYLMSEMGSGEYKTRIGAFGDGLNPWKKVRAASKSYDFDGAITHYNPNGLTCIDYLEEIAGEYYKIPTDIRNIYDALGNGVALIAIQKRTDQDYARGGQGTVEKARLVMNLDYLATGDHCIICALKLGKVKHFLERNLQNYEIHFKLEMGCRITPITDWMLSSRVNRKKYVHQYESGNDNPNGDDIFVRTVEGKNKRIAGKDILRWQESMPGIDVYRELSKIAGDSVRKPFLSDKGYFFQLAGILKKRELKNEESG